MMFAWLWASESELVSQSVSDVKVDMNVMPSNAPKVSATKNTSTGNLFIY